MPKTYTYPEVAERLGIKQASLHTRIWKWIQRNPAALILPDKREDLGGFYRHLFTEEGLARLLAWHNSNPIKQRGRKAKKETA